MEQVGEVVGDEATSRSRAERARRPLPGTIAGAASVGCGAIHLVAAGAHSGEPSAARAFLALALVQLAWGLVAVERPNRGVYAVGALFGTAAVGAWIAAITSGIGFVEGFEDPGPVRPPDALAALLAAVSAGGALVAALMPADESGTVGPTSSDGRPMAGGARRGVSGGAGVAAVAILTIIASLGAVDHAHGEDHLPGDADGHGHAGGAQAAGEHVGDDHPVGNHDDAVVEVEAQVSGTSIVRTDVRAEGSARPYDATFPVDLSGFPGVTPEQQARAEDLVERTLLTLGRFADHTRIGELGYHSIGDSLTGWEHYVNWGYLEDGRELDPEYPESLVYEVGGGTKRLAAAMYMAEGEVGLDEVPDIAGPMTQWHVHTDLCYTLTDPPRVVGVTTPGGPCRDGTRSLRPRPMIHVWIQPHPCGPFAALEGVGAGQIRPGEERLCDTAHGHDH